MSCVYAPFPLPCEARVAGVIFWPTAQAVGKERAKNIILSPAKGDISLSVHLPPAHVLQMPPLTGLGRFQEACSNPTACAVGQRTSPLPRLETGGDT